MATRNNDSPIKLVTFSGLYRDKQGAKHAQKVPPRDRDK